MHSPHVLAFAVLAQLVSPALADPAFNPEVSQATINDTICAPGYSYTVWPSYWESARIKLAVLKARGETRLDFVVHGSGAIYCRPPTPERRDCHRLR
jgi:hypothetical protein